MTSDEPGSPPPERPAGPARRSRRAGRTSQSFDFRERFGDPALTERREGLREPVSRVRQIPGRERLTVRELMEQMEAGAPQPAPSAAAEPPHPAAPSPSVPSPSVPSPPAPVPPPAGPDTTGSAGTGRAAATGEVTQALPPVVEPAPPVDLSESATQRRATLESRGQASPAEPVPADPATTESSTTESSTTARATAEPAPADPATSGETADQNRSGLLRRRRRPLEPTPNLTAAFEKVRASRRRPAPEQPRQRATVARYTGRVLLALSCTLVLVGTGYMWNTKRGWDGSWNTTAAIDSNDPNIRNKGAQLGDETYLIVGTDSRVGNNAKIGGGDADTIEGARADTILLVNIPADRSRVVAVSWPRDLQVDRPECQQWDPETGEYGEELYPAVGVKLNGVYAEGGPSCMVKTLTQMSGLNINHFIAMDFEGFEKVVNAIGGVNVCSTVPLYDYELGYILRRPGTKKLTGKRALNYVRARNISVEGNGDYGRIKRQQLFMSSLLRSTLSSDVLSNPSKLNRIVNTFIEYSTVDGVDTDSLIELANSMEGVDAGRVTFLTIPTSGTSMDGANNEIPRTDDIDAIFNAIIDDKPLPGEKKAPPAAKPSSTPGSPARTNKAATASSTDATAQYPGNITVRVLNGSGEPGAATAVMNRLIGEGINVPGVADASKRREDTVVRYGSGEKDSAATIAKMFPGARIQEDRTVKAGVEVILGSQFQGVSTIDSPPAPGSTLTVGQLPLANTNSDLPNDLSVTNAGDTTCS